MGDCFPVPLLSPSGRRSASVRIARLATGVAIVALLVFPGIRSRSLPLSLFQSSQTLSAAALPDTDPDEKAAAWVESIGGHVKIVNKRVVEIDLLNNGKLTDDGLKHVIGLQGLQRLTLGGTQVSDQGLKNLGELPSLVALNLNGTLVSDDGVKALNSFPSLSHIFLADTRVGDEGLKNAAGISKLAVVHLGGSRVTGAGLRHLQSVPGLVAVQLGGPNVSVQELRHVKGLKNLREFVLLSVEMTDSALEPLRELPKEIQTLWLSKSGLSADAMKSFSKDYPQAKFK